MLLVNEVCCEIKGKLLFSFRRNSILDNAFDVLPTTPSANADNPSRPQVEVATAGNMIVEKLKKSLSQQLDLFPFTVPQQSQ